MTALGADVLALQEVDRGQPRSGGVHQAELAAAAMGAAHWRFTGTVAGTPGEDGWLPATPASAGDGAGPGYGIALLSRLPVLEWHELRLTDVRAEERDRAGGARFAGQGAVEWLRRRTGG